MILKLCFTDNEVCMTVIGTGYYVSVEALVNARFQKGSILTKADHRNSINQDIADGRIIIGKPPNSGCATDQLVVIDNGTRYAWRAA